MATEHGRRIRWTEQVSAMGCFRNLDRLTRRWLTAGVALALVPVTVIGGLPNLSCACETSPCGDSANRALPWSPLPCSQPLPAARDQGQSVRSCCERHHESVGARDTSVPAGKGFSTDGSHCRVAVALRNCPDLSAAVGLEFQLGLPNALPIESATVAVRQVPVVLDTGPPVDLVLTLGHRLI